MGKREFFLASLLSIIFILGLMVISVNAAAPSVRLDNPSINGNLTGSNLTGDSMINITVIDPDPGTADSAEIQQVSNCTVFLRSASTANSSDISLGDVTGVPGFTIYNDTGNQTAFGSLVSSIFLDPFEDASDYVASATCRWENNTQINSSGVTGITIDYTSPDLPAISGLSPVDKEERRTNDVKFSASINDTSTTECLVNLIGVGTKSRTIGATETTCEITFEDIPEKTYEWYYMSSDGRNNTATGTRILTIGGSNKPSQLGTLIIQNSEEWKEQNKKQFLTIGKTEGSKKTPTLSFASDVWGGITGGWWIAIIVGIAVSIFVWYRKYR